MKRILVYASSLTLALATMVSAQNLSGLAAAFDDLEVGARAQALGGAYTAVAQGAASVFRNPAGLAASDGKSVEFSHLNQFSLIPYNTFAGALTIGHLHAVGLGIATNGDEQMRETTAMLAYAIKGADFFPGVLSALKVGFTLKYHSSSFGQNGFDPSDYSLFSEQEISEAQEIFASGDAGGLGIDFGLMYSYDERLHFGMSWRNLVSKVSWNNGENSYDEGIPQGMAIGVVYLTRAGFLLTADYDNSLTADRPNKLKFGTERVLMNRFALRGGIAQALASNSDRDYALGLGLVHSIVQFAQINLDYAYHIHPLADSHRFSLGLEF